MTISTQPQRGAADNGRMSNQSLRLLATSRPASGTLASLQVVPRARAVDAPPPEPGTTRVRLEAEIIEELDRVPADGERLAAAFARKEHALGTLFAQLSVDEARALHRRLELGSATDPISQRFARLVVDRQRRLLAFLGDARRRHAVTKGRGGR